MWLKETRHMALIIRGAKPTNVFQLMGTNENSATYALGWALEHSTHLRALVGSYIFRGECEMDSATIVLQRHVEDGGFTDIEISGGARFHCVIEAKRSWNVPTESQLRRYHPRLAASGARVQCLVSISSADVELARRKLPHWVGEVPVIHLSWSDLRNLAKRAHGRATKFEEKVWLRHLVEHLKEFVAMERITDNNVFVVALSGKAIRAGAPHTWIDVIEKEGRYFHPIGQGWPVQPPNYVGFRYGGKLRSVHHVDSFEVVANLFEMNALWPATTSDHFVYALGPAMRPPMEIKTGNIFRNGRVHCAIDTLLTGSFNTISDARDETKRRLKDA
jgi:hypothetical protein